MLLGAIHEVSIPEEDEILAAIEHERARETADTPDDEGPDGGSEQQGGNYVM